jgi:hypothetical protein
MTTASDTNATAAARRITEALSELLAALDDQQRAKVGYAFDDAQRVDWAYFPRNHPGLPLQEMDLRQQKLTHALVAGSLSLPAYAKVTSIMALESVLNLLEERKADAVRDPGRYFVSVYGAPGGDRWSWRFEGHHVCLNFTFAGGELLAPTPIFFGANPAEVRHGHSLVTKPCAEEEDAGRELLLSLDTAQKRRAVICDTAPPDFILMNVPYVPDVCLPGEAATRIQNILRFDLLTEEQRQALRFARTEPLGVAAAELSGRPRELLSQLIDVYVERLPGALAAVEREAIDRAGIDGIHFAWAGDESASGGHYYRLQGPSFLVEYDKTQDEANHTHAVWRDMARDFGGDPLRSHLAREH